MFSVANSQESELFENTWYLIFVKSDDMSASFNVAAINPPNVPYLIISEDLNFNGEGVCNIFNGTYDYYSPHILHATNFTGTSDDCGVNVYNRLEFSYFQFISGEFWYEILNDGEGLVLNASSPLGGEAVFKNYVLSTNDFFKNELSVYPNPVNDVLNLGSKNELGNSIIKIFNIEGKLLITENSAFENQISIGVSELSSGIYFLNIEDENGNRAMKKFIKQ